MDRRDVKGPTTREELILAVHSLFDTQVGEPRGYMEVPQEPDYYTTAYAGAWNERDRLLYQTLCVSGPSEEACVQLMWQDIRLLWECSEPRSRLYWRMSDRIRMTESGPDWWNPGTYLRTHRYKLRTRIAIPGSDTKFLGLMTCPGEGQPCWNI